MLCPLGDTGSRVLAGLGTLRGFAEPRLPGGLRRRPPAPGLARARRAGGPAGLSRAQGHGARCFSSSALALSPFSLSCCSAGWAGERPARESGSPEEPGLCGCSLRAPTACYRLGVFSRRCHTSRGHWGHRVLLSLAAFHRRTEGIRRTLICPEVQICHSSREDSVSLSLCLSFSLSPVQTITRPDFHHLGI